MSILDDEIQQLQLRIILLEKQKKEEQEKFKKESVEYNFTVMKNILNNKKNSNYIKPEPNDELLIKHLEATNNILQNFNDRLSKL